MAKDWTQAHKKMVQLEAGVVIESEWAGDELKMTSNRVQVNQLQRSIAADVKELLKLPDGTDIKVNFRADTATPERGGEISIKFSMPGAEPPTAKTMTGAPAQTDDDAVLLLGALRDAHEKNKQPFIALRWFKGKYLRALGINMPSDELNDLIMRLVAQGDLIIEKVPNRNPPFFDVTTVRTPDMPPPKNDLGEPQWGDQFRDRVSSS
jgi:hypothetical protein